MKAEQSVNVLSKLFSSETVVDLPAIRKRLGEVSAMTAFRCLRRIRYRRSYNHNGRYYTLFEPARFDRIGLWSWSGVHFSVDGSLRSTVLRLVSEEEAGATHGELQDRLRVRVQNTLLDLLRKDEVSRERIDEVFVYLHVDPAVRSTQMKRRLERIEAAEQEQTEVGDAVVILVLLQLIHHPGSKAADVVRRLRGRSPPISMQQVHGVFTRYGLEKKGGLLTS